MIDNKNSFWTAPEENEIAFRKSNVSIDESNNNIKTIFHNILENPALKFNLIIDVINTKEGSNTTEHALMNIFRNLNQNELLQSLENVSRQLQQVVDKM